MDEITLITHEEACKLLESEKDGKYEPWGKYYTITSDSKGETIYVGYDNSDGHCWVEEFYTISGCMAWLRGEMEVG